MTDLALVLRKLTSLRDHVARLRKRRSGEIAVYLADVDRQDALAMSLMVAVQEALDIALHLASGQGWGIPSTYGESFHLLAARGVVEEPLAAVLAGMAALRNRIAHGYAGVDAERVWNELPVGLSALDSYAAAVARHLGLPA